MFNWYPFKETEWDGNTVQSETTMECSLVRDGAKYFATKTRVLGECGLMVVDDKDYIVFSATTPDRYVERILSEMGFRNV